MNKNLITVALALSLSACGGSSGGSDVVDKIDDIVDQITNSPATFSGTASFDILVSDTESAALTNTIVVTDVDSGEALFEVQTDVSTDYGSFSIAANGEWSYSVDATNADIIALTSDDVLIDTITITTADGTTSEITINIAGITGEPGPVIVPGSAAATFSGDQTGSTLSDSTTIVEGTVIVTDTDGSEQSAAKAETKETNYGSFTINADGTWSYTLNNAKPIISALAIGVTKTDTIAIASADGTPSTIVITITGVNEIDYGISPSAFSGDRTATIANDDTSMLSGTVTVTEDDGAGTIIPDSFTSAYGTFSIDESGNWTYLLTTTDDSVSGLTFDHETLTDDIVITSGTGVSSYVSIKIAGTTDFPTYASNDTVPDVVCTEVVNSISALQSAADSVVAGDTLCLADGNYTGPLQLQITGAGTEVLPITVAAENPGGAIISGGESRIRLGGSHVIVQGFVLRDGESGSSIIKFEDAEECYNCRVTEVSVIDMDGGDFGSSNWVEYYGQYNRIDHSYFSGKESRGVILKLGRWTDGSVYPEDHAQIDHNYIGNRAPAWGRGYAGSSDNEYEGIRLGLSTTHQDPSYSTVEYNYFERIQGEAEIISNKSANNIIRNNTIHDSNGSIVTRHGEAADISNNFIFGDDNPFAGGIRLVDGEHTVTNNYIEGARFLSSNWNGGIVLTTGDGSGNGENGYQNVENVLVAHNTIVDSVNSLNVYGGKESTAPSSIYFVNNIIADAIGPVIRTNDANMPSGTIDGNYVYGQEFSDKSSLTAVSGIEFTDAELEKTTDGLYRPSATSPDLTAAVVSTGSFALPTIDMDGESRSATTRSGADADKNERELAPLSANDVGPKNYTPAPGKVYVQQVAITNHAFDSGDLTGWQNNGGEVITDATEVFSRGNSLKFDTNDAAAAQTVIVEANTNYTASAFMKGTAKLSVIVDGQLYAAERESSSYGFSSVTFNSGSDTTAVIKVSVDDGLPIEQMTDSDFVIFRSGDESAWTTVEGDSIGDIGNSSDSASGSDGSARLRYTKTTHANGSPAISQTVAVEADTDYNFAFDLLIKSAAEGAVAILNITGDDSVVIPDTELTMDDLVDLDLNKSFNRFTQAINSADNASLTITVSMKAQAIKSEAIESGTTLTDDSSKANEMRVDNISLNVDGAPAEGTEAFFDDIRLVSHPLSADESYAAEND